MNLLLDKLPEYINVDNQKHVIRTNFREWMKFELVMLNGSTDEEKSKILSHMIYDVIPENTECAVDEIINFYQCGKISKNNNTKNSASHKRVYDYEIDQYLIYTAFLRYYKIDLNVIDYMHWWTFRQLFLELPDESKMKKVMMYRSIVINSSMSTEQKKFYAEMKRTYALPTKGDAKKKAVGFGAILAGGMKTKEP